MTRRPAWLAAVWAGVCLGASVGVHAQSDNEKEALSKAAAGASIVASRTQGLCVLCHAVPGVPLTQSGTIGPSLSGVGARWSAQQLREHLMAPERFNPHTVMPSVSRTEGFARLAPARVGQPVLTETQIDAVVAYLVTLK